MWHRFLKYIGMKGVIFISLFFVLVSCGNKQQQPVEAKPQTSQIDTLQKTSASEAHGPIPAEPVPAIPMTPAPVTGQKADTIKNPSGIYSFIMPFDKRYKIQHTVRFYDNRSYRLQEVFFDGQNDSTVISEGTWAPSNGLIWLYKEQVVQARYKWKGDALQYFDPGTKKSYAMQKQTEILQNKVWQNKPAEGIVMFGIGNEPFWSVEFTNKDSLSFHLADWTGPVKMLITEKSATKDSSVFLAQNDSTLLRVVVFPYFCNDGMSDFTYEQKVSVRYNNKSFSGCGMLYK